LLSASDSSVRAGMSAEVRGRLTTGSPPTKLQRYASNEPCSRCTPRNACALRTDQAIFARLRMMRSSASSLAISRSPKRATFAGSKSRYARR
jgi:hypothetical protein